MSNQPTAVHEAQAGSGRAASGPAARRRLSEAAVLLLALWLRLPWPSPAWQHIDERAFILYPLGFFSGDLNPHFFNYPTLQFYLAAAAAFVYYLLAADLPLQAFIEVHYLTDGHALVVLSRFLGTAMAVVTVAVVRRLAARLYGDGAGLLAALLLAAMPLHARFSHLAATDVPAAMWVAVAVLAAVRVVQEGGRRRDLLVAGAAAGLAAATKYPAGLCAAAVGVAALSLPGRRWRHVTVAAAAGVAAFAAASPFVLLDAAHAWTAVAGMGAEHLLGDSHRTRDGLPLHLLRHNLRYGLGLAGLLTAAAGLLWRPRSMTTAERVLVAAVLLLAAFCLLVQSAFMRYAVPLAPLLAVMMVRPMTRLTRRRGIVAAWAMAVLVEPLHASLQARQLLSGPDTRVRAAEWLTLQGAGTVRLVDSEVRSGYVQVLTPVEVHARAYAYRASFGPARLAEAFRNLQHRDGLRPLFVRVALSTLAPHVTRPETAHSHAFVERPRHVLCDTSASVSRLEALGAVDWRTTFDCGDVSGSVFDPVDWYFLPVAGFGAVDCTGPPIDLGRVSLSMSAPVPSTSAFFGLLHGVQAATAATEEGRWQDAVDLYARILGPGYALDELLSTTYRYDLLNGLGETYYRLGRPAAAVQYWERAAESRPGDRRLLIRLAAAYRDLGRRSAADGALERARAAGHDP